MNTNLLHITTDLEMVLEKIDGSITFWPFKKIGTDPLGQPVYDYGIRWWRADSNTPRKETAEGKTPSEAVENLLKKLEMI